MFRRRVLVRGSLLLMAASGIGVVLYVLAVFPPAQHSFYPKCISYQLTGLHCPGCGATRAVHALLNGNLTQAAAYNPVALVLLPYTFVLILRSLLQDRDELKPRARWATLIPWVIAAVLIAFGLLRNVPVYPFTLLAPHELAP